MALEDRIHEQHERERGERTVTYRTLDSVSAKPQASLDACKLARGATITFTLRRCRELRYRLALAGGILKAAVWLANRVGSVRCEVREASK